MHALTWISDHRWPIGITGVLLFSMGANAVLLYHATRPDAPRPMDGWYERSLTWDQELATREASRDLDWNATFAVPAGPEYASAMPRPIDLVLTGRDGAPVTGLTGTFTAHRPSDATLDNTGTVVELPHAPGTYRALVTFPVDGLWEVEARLASGALTWVGSQRLTLSPPQAVTP